MLYCVCHALCTTLLTVFIVILQTVTEIYAFRTFSSGRIIPCEKKTMLWMSDTTAKAKATAEAITFYTTSFRGVK